MSHGRGHPSPRPLRGRRRLALWGCVLGMEWAKGAAGGGSAGAALTWRPAVPADRRAGGAGRAPGPSCGRVALLRGSAVSGRGGPRREGSGRGARRRRWPQHGGSPRRGCVPPTPSPAGAAGGVPCRRCVLAPWGGPGVPRGERAVRPALPGPPAPLLSQPPAALRAALPAADPPVNDSRKGMRCRRAGLAAEQGSWGNRSARGVAEASLLLRFAEAMLCVCNRGHPSGFPPELSHLSSPHLSRSRGGPVSPRLSLSVRLMAAR